MITVLYSRGLYHLKSKEEIKGTFISLGSTNRLADAHIIAEICRLKEDTSFDQFRDCNFSIDDFDFELAKEMFALLGKPLPGKGSRLLLKRTSIRSLLEKKSRRHSHY